jgi:DNA-binding MarR family transcriptional regulator
VKDRRRKRLHLTKKGQEIIDKVEPYRLESNKRLFDFMTELEKDAFMRILKSCSDKFDVVKTKRAIAGLENKE